MPPPQSETELRPNQFRLTLDGEGKLHVAANALDREGSQRLSNAMRAIEYQVAAAPMPDEPDEPGQPAVSSAELLARTDRPEVRESVAPEGSGRGA